MLSPYLFALYINGLSVKLNCVKAGCFLGNSRLNHIIYADDLCCFSPSLDGLQDLLNVCSNFAVEHDITFNCSKSVGVLFLPKYLSLSNGPKVFLCNNVVKFKNNIKYLGVFLNNNLKDDDDICRQVRYLYGKSYQLKATFSKCSRTIKNILFNYHCTSFYASHLWSKYLCSSLNHLRVAYNDSFRLIHGLKRNVSARELEVKANILTFDALQRKLIYRFIERCCLSSNVYVNSGWSNFFTFAGHFSNLFELAGLRRLEIVGIIVSSKKKGLHLESISDFPIFVPKTIVFSKKINK